MEIVFKNITHVNNEDYNCFQEFINFLKFKQWYDEFNTREKEILRNIVFYDEHHYLWLLSYQHHDTSDYDIKNKAQLKRCMDYVYEYYAGSLYFEDYIGGRGTDRRKIDYGKVMKRENFRRFFNYINYVLTTSDPSAKFQSPTIVNAMQLEINYILNFDDVEFTLFDEYTMLNPFINVLIDSYNSFPDKNFFENIDYDNPFIEDLPIYSSFFYGAVSNEEFKVCKKYFLDVISNAVCKKNIDLNFKESIYDIYNLGKAIDIFERKILK